MPSSFSLIIQPTGLPFALLGGPLLPVSHFFARSTRHASEAAADTSAALCVSAMRTAVPAVAAACTHLAPPAAPPPAAPAPAEPAAPAFVLTHLSSCMPMATGFPALTEASSHDSMTMGTPLVCAATTLDVDVRTSAGVASR